MSRKTVVTVLALAAVAVLGVVLVVFQPQKLFIDERIDEALPAAAASALPTTTPSVAQSAAPSTSTSPAAPAATSSLAPSVTAVTPSAAAETAAAAAVRGGMFRSLDHTGTGRASLLPSGDAHLVRFEDLDVENGPDLYVYLSTAPGDADESAFDDDFISLGRLKGNQGNQNYAIPTGTDVSKYKSVVVWCKRFSSGFAVAPLV